VRPGVREGKLLLPLAREIASDAPVAIELTFIHNDTFPKRHGTVAFASPRFDVPMKNAHWDLYLPPDYEYSQFEGSMARTSDAATPMVQVFSLSEYNVQQQAQEEQKRIELRYGLQSARENLSGGNLRQAISSFSRAKVKGQEYKQLAEGDKDLREVERELRRAQSSNLINAQNTFFADNAGRLGDQQALQAQANAPARQRIVAQTGASVLNNDADIAALQWDKLERAQQVAVAKVAPLRVNLPTRGAHYSFAQVLQTELRKSMTVRMTADNTKVPNWTARLGLALVGFCALWILMAILARRKEGNAG